MNPDTCPIDFFVSYARKDNESGWVTGFVEHLLAEHTRFSPGRELKAFFDRKDIHAGADWEHTLHHGIARARLFLAFVSPHYFASEWCRREWRAWIDSEIAKHILTQGVRPVYLVEVPGYEGTGTLDEQEVARKVAELCGLPTPHAGFIESTAPVVKQVRRRQLLRDFVLPFHDVGLEALRREDLRRVLHDFARDLDEQARRVAAAAASESTVPPYNRKFTGRLDELLDLRKRLTDDQAGVVCGVQGLGGIGKTELAYTYAHAFASAYPGGRFDIPCEGQSNLRQAVLRLGEFHDFLARIGDEERKQPETHFAAIARCLDERLARLGHILLVLDNVTDPSLVSPRQTDCLTTLGPKLHLLATTRKLPPAGGNWLVLGELPDADALALLEKHRPFAGETDLAAARSIVKRLGGFALAVELVAAWLAAHPGATYLQFKEQLGLHDLEDMAQDATVALRRHNHERRLNAVLGPVLADLKPEDRRTLEYAALLPANHVALPWLQALVSHDFPEAFQPTRLLANPWVEHWQRLVRLALFSRAEEETTEPCLLRVHRLLQDLVLQGLPDDEKQFRQQAVDALVTTRNDELEKTTRWEEARWELEPLEALAWQWANPPSASEDPSALASQPAHPQAAWLLNQVAFFWHTLADWSRAAPLMRRALEIDESSYGENHPKVAIRLNNLAQLLNVTNRLAEAEPLMRRALLIDESSYGENHPDVARDLNNLAQMLQATNRLAEAESLMRRALPILEHSFGEDHPRVATAQNNLAQMLQATNRLAEAEPLMRRALMIDESSYGENHPDVARDLNNLAQLLKATNRLAEAEPLMRRALMINESSYGENHPSVATRLNNLALLLQAANQLAEAESLMRRVLPILEHCFGKDHPRVATAQNNLGWLLKETSRLAEAEPLMRRALMIDESSYGEIHPDVARDLSNLAQLLQATNRLAEAEPLMRRALMIYESSYGENHPDVARALNNLAQLLQATNRLAEAEPLMRRALMIDESSYGKNHPDVARDLNNLALLLQATNRLMEAESLMKRALKIDESSFGESHPNVARDLSNMAQLVLVTNRLAEAESLISRALAIAGSSLGGNHPTIATLSNNMAAVLKGGGRNSEAEPFLRRALKIDTEVFGENHPNVARDLNNLAVLLHEGNRLSEAELLMFKALRIDEESYGNNHPDVARDLNNLAALLFATNRLAEAVSLVRRQLGIYLNFSNTVGHQHPYLQVAAGNYAGLLQAQGRSPAEIQGELKTLGEAYGIQLGTPGG